MRPSPFPALTHPQQLVAQAISTPLFRFGDSLEQFILDQSAPYLAPQRILAITSKLFSIAENRVGKRSEGSKQEWIAREADQVVTRTLCDVVLTVTRGVLLPTAGIDESNSEHGDFLLLPVNPYESLKKLHQFLSSKLGFSDFGLLMTDSRTQPLRVGVTGLALAHYGFVPVRDRRGTPDLFGRELKMTTINDADPLASVAVMLMGESNESQPLAILQCPSIKMAMQGEPADIQIRLENDLYGYPLSQSSKGV